MDGIFNDTERELIDAARIILADGVTRLKKRDALFPTNRNRGRAVRQECREAREALTDKLVADYGSLRHEIAVCVLIDAQGRLIDIREFPQGKANHCEISGRILAGFIVDTGACAVLLAHNHPSGDNSPSPEDEKVTTMYVSWLRVMDCELIDHLILSGNGASSIMGDWL
jgi:DNA repair protein RadC